MAVLDEVFVCDVHWNPSKTIYHIQTEALDLNSKRMSNVGQLGKVVKYKLATSFMHVQERSFLGKNVLAGRV